MTIKQSTSGRREVWLSSLLWKQDIAGSNPAVPTHNLYNKRGIYLLYALSENEERILAEKEIVGFCSICGEKLIPKCGKINIWHWSHKGNTDCDKWSEGETEWHLNWKNYIDENNREVIIRKNGIVHRADILNEKNVVVELQHSYISPDEIKEREEFYDNMVWLFDVKDVGDRIKGDFTTKEEYINLHIRKYLNTSSIKYKLRGIYIPSNRYTIDERYIKKEKMIVNKLSEEYDGKKDKINFSYSFKWKNKKKSIFTCIRPVFLDVGKNIIIEVHSFNKKHSKWTHFWGKYITYEDFILKYLI